MKAQAFIAELSGRTDPKGNERTELCEERIVGVNDEEVPPVPIPNTVVKLLGAEDTWRETARENRAMPTFSFFIRIPAETAR